MAVIDDKSAQQWVEADPSDASPAAIVEDYQPGSEAEKKLLRKLDMRLIVWRALTNHILGADRVASLAAGFSWGTVDSLLG